MTRHAGGPDEATTAYQTESSPPLLICETAPHPQTVLDQVNRLAEVCEPTTNLILAGKANDIELYRSLMHIGVADYVVLPAEPTRLVEAIVELYEQSENAPVGRIIAFIGTKGGCGSSTLAQNTAFALAESEDCDVVVIDLDLPFGSADLTLNLEAPHGIRNVLVDPERVDNAFLQRFTAKYTDRLHLLAAPCSLEDETGVETHALEVTLDAIKRQAKFIVLDLPHLWTTWLRHALQQADEVVLTAMPDLVSVRNTRNLIDYLSGIRSLDEPPILVINRVGAAKKSEVPLKDFSQTVGLQARYTIHEDSDGFGRAFSQGKMLEEVAPRSKAAEAIRSIAMAAGGIAPKVEKSSLSLASLLGRKG